MSSPVLSPTAAFGSPLLPGLSPRSWPINPAHDEPPPWAPAHRSDARFARDERRFADAQRRFFEREAVQASAESDWLAALPRGRPTASPPAPVPPKRVRSASPSALSLPAAACPPDLVAEPAAVDGEPASERAPSLPDSTRALPQTSWRESPEFPPAPSPLPSSRSGASTPETSSSDSSYSSEDSGADDASDSWWSASDHGTPLLLTTLARPAPIEAPSRQRSLSPIGEVSEENTEVGMEASSLASSVSAGSSSHSRASRWRPDRSAEVAAESPGESPGVCTKRRAVDEVAFTPRPCKRLSGSLPPTPTSATAQALDEATAAPVDDRAGRRVSGLEKLWRAAAAGASAGLTTAAACLLGAAAIGGVAAWWTAKGAAAGATVAATLATAPAGTAACVAGAVFAVRAWRRTGVQVA